MSEVDLEQAQPTAKIESAAKQETRDTKLFNIEGSNVRVNFNLVSPDSPNPTSDNLIVFLPGFALSSSSKSAELIAKGFANVGARNVLVADNLSDETKDDYLNMQTRAIGELVKERGVKNVTIVGYSEGGIKAINLAAELQKQKEEGASDINIDGLVLMESAGLYDQGGRVGFIERFAVDGLIRAAREVYGSFQDRLPSGARRVFSKESFANTKRTLRISVDVGGQIAKDAIRMGVAPYVVDAWRKSGEIGKATSRLSQVKAPVILVQGQKDTVIQAKKILPDYKDVDNREQTLKNSLFPNSPYVRMITGERVSTHGMPIVRAEQIAKTSLYMLERSKRDLTGNTPKT